VRDPGEFRDRETWLAYLMGYQDARTELEALLRKETPDLE